MRECVICGKPARDDNYFGNLQREEGRGYFCPQHFAMLNEELTVRPSGDGFEVVEVASGEVLARLSRLASPTW